MSQSLNQLALKREILRLRCMAQRAEIELAAQAIEEELGGIDRGIGKLRRVVSSPLLLGTGAAVMAVVGPGRIFRMLRWAGRAALVRSIYQRLVKS